MPATESRLRKNAMFMIHKCWCLIAGNEDELAAQIPVMRKSTTRCGYVCRTHDAKQIPNQSMDESESWFSADEANNTASPINRFGVGAKASLRRRSRIRRLRYFQVRRFRAAPQSTLAQRKCRASPRAAARLPL